MERHTTRYPAEVRELWRKFAHIINEPRPFIRAGDFFGPDRRRRVELINFPDRRISGNTPMASDDDGRSEHFLT